MEDAGNFWDGIRRAVLARKPFFRRLHVSLIRQVDRPREINKPMRIGSVGKIGKTGEQPNEAGFAMTGLCAPCFARADFTANAVR